MTCASPAARSLSPREVECLGFVAHGFTDAEAAARLRVSTHTIQFHLRNARDKLGAKTKAQAVFLATKRLLI